MQKTGAPALLAPHVEDVHGLQSAVYSSRAGAGTAGAGQAMQVVSENQHNCSRGTDMQEGAPGCYLREDKEGARTMGVTTKDGSERWVILAVSVTKAAGTWG